MKFLTRCKDGGPDSHVEAFVLVEIKHLFSIMLLKFAPGSRPVYHTHAFNSISWLLKGTLLEFHKGGTTDIHTHSVKPIFTYRDTYHKVYSTETSWALTFRGPWVSWWKEYAQSEYTLTHGRQLAA